MSSYGSGNHDELMDQYNRLLDVFNNEEPREANILESMSNQQIVEDSLPRFKENISSIEENQMNVNHSNKVVNTMRTNSREQTQNGKSKFRS